MSKAHQVVRLRIKLNLQGVLLLTQNMKLGKIINLKALETFDPESQARPVHPRRSIGPSPPRPSKIPVLQERSQEAIDAQQTSQVVKPKRKVLSKLDMAKQFLKIGLPSSTDKCIERWWEYRDMQDTRKKSKELKREERSRNPHQKHGQIHSHNSTFFSKEPETYKQAISSVEQKLVASNARRA